MCYYYQKFVITNLRSLAAAFIIMVAKGSRREGLNFIRFFSQFNKPVKSSENGPLR